MTKISILCFDLAHNCLGRAYLLAQVLRRRYEVEILGTLFDKHGGKIWGPCDTGEFAYQAVPGGHFPGYLRSFRDLARRIQGDVMVASKARLPSLGVGLYERWRSHRPLIVDLDDDETSWFSRRDRRRWRRQLRDPTGFLYTSWMERSVKKADGVIVASRTLQRRYGGTLVPHGRDPTVLDPQRFDGRRERARHGLSDAPLLMFLGTPRPHKGVEELIEALKLLPGRGLQLLIVGCGREPYEQQLKQRAGNAVHWIGQVKSEEVPRYLSMADLVVLPQRRGPQTASQVPAKVFDAMAMARPIIATRVSDLPEILEGCGVLVEPNDVQGLAAAIGSVLDDLPAALDMGRRARDRCIASYSFDALEAQLVEVIEAAINRR